eukprot:758843-Hanusia_phi.AAC.1
MGVGVYTNPSITGTFLVWLISNSPPMRCDGPTPTPSFHLLSPVKTTLSHPIVDRIHGHPTHSAPTRFPLPTPLGTNSDSPGLQSPECTPTLIRNPKQPHPYSSLITLASASTILRMSSRPAQDAGDLPDAGWGGEKKAHTRDPASTKIDPTDPKSKQTYIPPTETFEEYLKRRQSSAQKAPNSVITPVSGPIRATSSGVVDLKSVAKSRHQTTNAEPSTKQYALASCCCQHVDFSAIDNLFPSMST